MSDETNTPDPLRELQKAFCLFFLQSECRIGDLQQIQAIRNGDAASELQMYRHPDGKLLMERHLETLPVSSDTAKIINEFRRSPNTTVYTATAFSPKSERPDVLNLWSPSPVVPVPGNCTVIVDFLQQVLCGGDSGCFAYLLRYLAHMLRVPEEKPGVMIVLLGGQGTGKGTFFKLLEAIWPHVTLRASDVEHVTGTFNAALERHYVICMDEALFFGDRKSTDKLKSIITEGKVTIEQKYQPRRTIDSYHRIFAASNHKHFAHVDTDDRRFVFLSLPDTYQGNTFYWQEIHSAISHKPYIQAFVHDLMSLDLTDFDVRVRPKTVTLVDQKLRSLTGFARFWFEVLHASNAQGYSTDLLFMDGKGSFVSTSNMMDAWQAYDKTHRWQASGQQRDLHATMAEVCPSAVVTRHKVGSLQQRGFDLPTVAQAQAEFEAWLGGPVCWPT